MSHPGTHSQARLSTEQPCKPDEARGKWASVLWLVVLTPAVGLLCPAPLGGCRLCMLAWLPQHVGP